MDAKTLNATLIVEFECVVCTEYMHPPIVQCVEGHSVCHNCHKKLGKCPTCRQVFDVRCRSQVLESLHSRLMFPCKYNEKGCKVEKCGFMIQEHEKFCEHKPEPKHEGGADSGSIYYINSLLDINESGPSSHLSILEHFADLDRSESGPISYLSILEHFADAISS